MRRTLTINSDGLHFSVEEESPRPVTAVDMAAAAMVPDVPEVTPLANETEAPKAHPMKGKHLSPAHKAKIRAAFQRRRRLLTTPTKAKAKAGAKRKGARK